MKGRKTKLHSRHRENLKSHIEFIVLYKFSVIYFHTCMKGVIIAVCL